MSFCKFALLCKQLSISQLELDQVIQDQGLGLNITVLSIYKEVHAYVSKNLMDLDYFCEKEL